MRLEGKISVALRDSRFLFRCKFLYLVGSRIASRWIVDRVGIAVSFAQVVSHFMNQCGNLQIPCNETEFSRNKNLILRYYDIAAVLGLRF